MSLGANYGIPLIDDLSEASRNAVRAGITVVASAGNSGDIPFISGTPGSTDTVISVAASQPAQTLAVPVAVDVGLAEAERPARHRAPVQPRVAHLDVPRSAAVEAHFGLFEQLLQDARRLFGGRRADGW